MFFARYFYAILWTLLLASFSYTELLVSSLFVPNVHFEEKIIELLNSRIMLLSSVGLVAMLFVDNIITKKITRDNTQHSNFFVGVVIASIITVIFLAVLAEGIEKKSFVIPNWFRLGYLFVFFLCCLTAYKAETLNIKHSSSNITESKIN